MKRRVAVWLTGMVLAFVPAKSVFAQRTAVYTHEDALFKSAYELFQKQKYGAAQKQFLEVAQAHPKVSVTRTDAEYYAAICGMELFNKDAELMLKNFITNHPESPHVKKAYFHLGKYNYRKKKYDDAVEWFAKVDVYDLNRDELPEYYFKRGYSYFELQQAENAKKDFFEIKDVDTKYTPPANYYFSHLAYSEKNYETALGGFLKLTKNETFGPIVPYYIAQIYYLQGRYDEVIAFAPPLIDSSNTKRAPEIARIIGESYFKKGRYADAIPFLKRYERSVGTLSREDSYELGYACYQVKDYDNATAYLQGAVSIQEGGALTQNAYYHLGDCYVRQNKKQFALSAFYSASKSADDKQVQEDALFNYAKLCYELAFNPYNEAVNAFKKYIADYPKSPRVDEAFGYLTNVYLTTKNFKEALASIESIRVLSPQLKPLYQRIAYNRGVEFYNNTQMDSAVRMFDKALVYSMDKNLSSQSFFWKAEAQYRMGQYDKALENYRAFMFEPGAFNQPQFNLTNYCIGYAQFKKKDYAGAIVSFRKFTNSKTKEDPKKLNDAQIRIGDAYFMTRDYANAVDYYDQAIKMKLFDTDYAIYQKSMALGVQRKNEAKVSTLQQLLNGYPNSNYSAAAKFELGKTWLLLNDNDKAMSWYEKVIGEHPNSSYVPRSILQTGVIHRNKKEDDAAIARFRKVVSNYPNSDESKEALGQLRKLYEEKGDMKTFEEYIKNIPFANFSKSSLDSSSYAAAKNSYFGNDCGKAIASFGDYLQRYPEGIFVLEANYYRSDCQYRTEQLAASAEGYKYVASKPRNKFTEQSLLNLSTAYYKLRNYAEANTYYNRLESVAELPRNIMDARIGQMRCSYLLKDHANAIRYGRTVLATDKVSVETIHEARLTIGKAALESGDQAQALSELKICAAGAKSVLGAEARYLVAEILFAKNELAESKKHIFDLANQEPAHPYWMTKGFLLLSDIYVAQKDNFQAKTTLQSVISDSDIPELITVAQAKLDAIIASEKAPEPKPQEQLQIQFNNKGGDGQLFREEPVQEEPKKEEPIKEGEPK